MSNAAGVLKGNDLCFDEKGQLDLIQVQAQCQAQERVMNDCVKRKEAYPIKQFVYGGVIGALIGGVAVGLIK